MKRKIKLLTSIASLSLAFAMMAVGIFALAQRTVSVGGSLSFEAVNVDAIVDIHRIAPVATKPTTPTWITDNITTPKHTFTSSDANQQNGTTNIDTVEFTETNVVFMIRIQVKNDGARAMTVAITPPPKLDGVETSVVSITADSSNTTGTLAAGATGTYIYVFELLNKKAADFNATNGAYSFSVLLTRG